MMTFDLFVPAPSLVRGGLDGLPPGPPGPIRGGDLLRISEHGLLGDKLTRSSHPGGLHQAHLRGNQVW